MTENAANRYLALPPSGRGAGVLVLHAWWGLTDFIREFCDRLALEGFVALAPDMFSGRVARTVAEAEQLTSQISETEDVPPVVLGAAQQLSRHPAVAGGGKLGVVGFSFGGYWSMWLAEQRPDIIRAVTVFYGTDGGGGDYGRSRAAYLGHFAQTDPYEPVEGLRALEDGLRAAGRPASFHTYPATGHWFFEKYRPEAYNADAADLAWSRTVEFLRGEIGD